MARAIKRNIKHRKCDCCGDTIEYHESEVKEVKNPGAIYSASSWKEIKCPSCPNTIQWDIVD